VSELKRDYYEVLGVARDADGATIHAAFQELARAWHPDVADVPEAETRFRELAEAYSVLSKREARLLYDRHGYRGRGEGGLDEAVWAARQPEVARGENIYTEVEVRSFEAEEGTRRVITFHAITRCTACTGRGAVGLPDPDCTACLGTGRTTSPLHSYFDEVSEAAPCPECVGEPCARCGGRGTVEEERRLRVRIPPGVQDDAQLRVSGDGHDAGAGSEPGDLLVRVHVLPPPKDPRSVRYIALGLLLVAIAALALYIIR
jgi:molecular chaperone DnaJ